MPNASSEETKKDYGKGGALQGLDAKFMKNMRLGASPREHIRAHSENISKASNRSLGYHPSGILKFLRTNHCCLSLRLCLFQNDCFYNSFIAPLLCSGYGGLVSLAHRTMKEEEPCSAWLREYYMIQTLRLILGWVFCVFSVGE